MAKISVIIPVYNAEEFLPECLDSVLDQTHKNFEIICVNDGSTDNSLSVLNAYAKMDKRIKVYTQENQGQSSARNKGLDVAKGRYIFFLDSDDFIHPQTLEATHYHAQKNKTELTAFLYEKEEKAGDFKDMQFETYDIKRLPNLVRCNLMAYTDKNAKPRVSRVVTTMLFHRNIFKNLRFKPGMYYEDTQLLLTILKDNVMSTLLPIPFYKYRMNATSTTNQKFTEKHLKSYHTLLSDLRKQYSHAPYRRKLDFLIKTLVEPVCQTSVKRVMDMSLKEKRKMIFPLYQMISEMRREGAISPKEDEKLKNLTSNLIERIKKDLLKQKKRRILRLNPIKTRKITSSQVKKIRFKDVRGLYYC
ncbi:MAG: glycosyltransferase [Alphaproteobacteria bacterium]|jgi:glycosyltransferase involved in cell wall biosynthesis|nr:glycosyltransferase [Alphaproteobacteria bacterium]